MQSKILIVDDAIDHQQMILSILGNSHFLSQAFTLTEAKKLLVKNTYDLILLDISLPDGDGLSFYAEMLSENLMKNSPVIFVTAHSEANKEIMGFSLGAEDYIVKPIEPGRLRARIESRLKHLEGKKNKDLVLSKGNLKISVSYQQVTVIHDGAEVPIDLTPVEFKLLFHFLRYEEHVFSREQLLAAVWGNTADVIDRTVDMHVSNLRKKITLSNYKIKAIHGSGYRMTKSLSDLSN